MKRSEMLKKFEDWIHDNMDFDGESHIYMNRVQSDILDFFEEQGMLSPETIVDESHKNLYPHLNDAEFYEYAFRSRQHKWEEE